MIKGIIFDLGWTLMFFDGDWNQVTQSSYKRLIEFLYSKGIQVPSDFADQLHAARQRSWRRADDTGIEQTVEDALRETLNNYDYTTLNGVAPSAVRVFFEEIEDHWQAYPDAVETLQALAKQKLQIGLISNADDIGLVYREVQRLGFAPYLSPVRSSAEEPRWRKPDPRIFHLFSDQWQIDPGEIVMVGDSPLYDTLGAHRSGMRGIWIDHNENFAWQRVPDDRPKDPAAQPDAVVHSLIEIPQAIANW